MENERNRTKVLSEDDKKLNGELRPYHRPVFSQYGALAELVQIHPGIQSDGGIMDCQHF